MSASTSENIALGAAFALGTSFIMSIAAALIKYAATMVSIEVIVAVQYLLCTAIMLPWLARRGVSQLKTEHFRLHVVRALCGWACFYAYYLAIEKIPLVDAALLRNAAPLCVPFLVLAVYGVRIALIRWIPLVIGMAGIALILKPDASGLNGWYLVGFASAVTLAGSIMTTRMLALTEPTNRILFYYFGFSAVASVPLALLNWQPIPAAAWPPMLLIGGSIWLTMWLYTKAYQYAKASIISPISYTGVAFTGFWGWLIWQQIPDQWTYAGVLLVAVGGVGSVILGAQEERRKRASHAS